MCHSDHAQAVYQSSDSRLRLKLKDSWMVQCVSLQNCRISDPARGTSSSWFIKDTRLISRRRVTMLNYKVDGS